MRPVIGITTRRRRIDTVIGPLDVETAELPYTQAVQLAGGIPIALIPAPSESVAGLLDTIDGLILSGGGDIDPSFYDGRTVPELYDVDADRDEFELEVVRVAKDRKIPTLAICRGLQVVNVAFGGTLIEHIGSADGSPHPHAAPESAWQGHLEVTLDPRSRTAAAMRTDRPLVNSVHHQAVREPGTGLRVVGRSIDGHIEALEPEAGDWSLIAVQWHPEYLARIDAPSQSLFNQLISAAAAKTTGL